MDKDKMILIHHGIEGQKWGRRNGPPYPLDYKSHSAAEKHNNSKSTLDNYDPSSKRKSNVGRFVRENKKKIIVGGVTAAAVGAGIIVGAKYVNRMKNVPLSKLEMGGKAPDYSKIFDKSSQDAKSKELKLKEDNKRFMREIMKYDVTALMTVGNEFAKRARAQMPESEINDLFSDIDSMTERYLK